MPLNSLFGKTLKMLQKVISLQANAQRLNRVSIILAEAINRVLHLPMGAEKIFLITIGDRSMTGMVVRDQIVGPWQMPIALLNFFGSARLTVDETLTNLAAAHIGNIKRVKLFANGMTAVGHPGEPACTRL